MSVLELPDGRFVVPGNRWDLVAPAAERLTRLPRVRVVIPYYDAPSQLTRALIGLSLQTYPAGLLDVVVADDGSPEPPRLDRSPVPVTLVRQRDLGFRAAAARNLGARAGSGDDAGAVLCFLDQDMIPEPGYVDRIVRLVAVLPDALVMGRRRHADLGSMDDGATRRWLSGAGPAPTGFTEPAWLSDAYQGSRNLLDADDASFRHVISAVMACSRALFDELGGFDESFAAYGGEDWDFAYRAWTAGAVLAHEPRAVAWHDGPDWAARGTEQDRAAEKRGENRRLARLVPHPVTRPRPEPDDELVDVVVQLAAGAVVGADAGEVVDAALATGLDLAVYAVDQESRRARGRVRTGPPPAAVLDRARFVVEVDDAAALAQLPQALADLDADDLGRLTVAPGFTVTRTRALRRAWRWQAALGRPDLVGELFGSRTWNRAGSPEREPARG